MHCDELGGAALHHGRVQVFEPCCAGASGELGVLAGLFELQAQRFNLLLQLRFGSLALGDVVQGREDGGLVIEVEQAQGDVDPDDGAARSPKADLLVIDRALGLQRAHQRLALGGLEVEVKNLRAHKLLCLDLEECTHHPVGIDEHAVGGAHDDHGRGCGLQDHAQLFGAAHQRGRGALVQFVFHRVGVLGGHLQHRGQVVALGLKRFGDVVGMRRRVLQHELQVALLLLELEHPVA